VSDRSPKDVADQFGISRSAVYRLIEAGELVGYTTRGRLRIEPAEGRAFKERNPVIPARALGRSSLPGIRQRTPMAPSKPSCAQWGGQDD
jgi:excisionase family DNA binding protein